MFGNRNPQFCWGGERKAAKSPDRVAKGDDHS